MSLGTQVACHTYLPPQEVVPVSGRNVSVTLNDRGRLMLGDRLGEAVLRVDGRIVASTDSEVTLSVARTVLLQGSSVVWTGESVVIPREGVREFRVREFSRSRTVMFSAAVIGGLVLLGGLISLVAGGNGRPGDGSGCAPNCGGT